MITVQRWVLAVSVTALVGATPGLALADSSTVGKPATFAKQGVSIKRLTAGVQMTKDDPVPARAFGGPSHMLADPSNPRIIVAATEELRTRVCYLMRSSNAGRTWQILPALPAPGSYPYCTSNTAGVPLSNLAWGRDGTLYYALDGYDNADGGDSSHANYSVLLSRSTNLGNSWTSTVAVANRGKTGPNVTHAGPVTGLAVDTSGPKDVVYLGFSESFPNAATGSPQKGDNTMVAVSTNGGATFGAPVNINTFSHVTYTIGGTAYPLDLSSFGTPYLAAHDGVVIAVAGGNGTLAANIPSTNNGLPELVARSADQGRTWTVSTLSPAVVTPTGAQTGMGWTPKGGPYGTFLATYAATPDEGTYAAPQILLQRSTDAGLTWSSPVVLDDDTNASQLYTSFFPQLNVAPNGRVDVIWWDNRRSNQYSYDIYYSWSTNGGVTWSHNLRVTDQPSNFGAGISFGSDVRQPPGVASANQYAAFGWTDTRFATSVTETQDNFGSVAEFAPVPSSTNALVPVLAAVFAGLLIAGLVLIVLISGRRRRGGPTPPPSVEAREPVGTA
ncbi:MAG: hypothetical protein ACRDYC_12000 [Acidimicrobiales bacterium]